MAPAWLLLSTTALLRWPSVTTVEFCACPVPARRFVCGAFYVEFSEASFCLFLSTRKVERPPRVLGRTDFYVPDPRSWPGASSELYKRRPDWTAACPLAHRAQLRLFKIAVAAQSPGRAPHLRGNRNQMSCYPSTFESSGSGSASTE